MAPSGVQKERMRTQDMFVLDLKGNELVQPESRPPPYKPPKLSECAPLFMLVCLSRFTHHLSSIGGGGQVSHLAQCSMSPQAHHSLLLTAILRQHGISLCAGLRAA